MSEARQAVDAVRVAAGLPRIWSSYAPLTGPIYSWIFYEASGTATRDLFRALNEARTNPNLGLLPVAYPAGTPLPANMIKVYRAHLETIRAGVK